jgi:LmbE family N-acetylglucosaminyl deacetylase
MMAQACWSFDMIATSTLVVLHAHPDDEAIFTGATIRRAVDQGARVVLVSATGGEAGECRLELAGGETLHRRRLAELERACDLLGVARLVLLGHRDSGAHRGPYAPGTLGAAALGDVVARVEQVVRAENADALVHQRGITGHVDHRQVHRAGRQVAARLGLTAYEATLDRAALRRGAYPLARAATDEPDRMGVAPRSVSLTLTATERELTIKREAMAVHRSQIAPEALDASTFTSGYGREWFLRRGAPGVLDALATGSGHEAAASRDLSLAGH